MSNRACAPAELQIVASRAETCGLVLNYHRLHIFVKAGKCRLEWFTPHRTRMSPIDIRSGLPMAKVHTSHHDIRSPEREPRGLHSLARVSIISQFSFFESTTKESIGQWPSCKKDVEYVSLPQFARVCVVLPHRFDPFPRTLRDMPESRHSNPGLILMQSSCSLVYFRDGRGSAG